MSYSQQRFDVDQALDASHFNQFSENTELVRTSHKAPSEPAQITPGIVWIDDTSVPWEMKVRADDAWQVIAKIDPEEDYAWGINEDLVTDEQVSKISKTTEDPTGLAGINEDAWVSYGRTDSGAGTIWTALDDVPTEADWILIRMASTAGDGSGDSGYTDLYSRRYQDTTDTAAVNKVARFRILEDGKASCGVLMTSEFTVPVDDQTRFELYYDKGGEHKTIELSLIGYGFNR